MTWDDYSADILEDGFSIERSTSPDGEYYSIGAVDKNITTFIDKSNNKREDQTYYYKLSGIFKRTWVQGQTVASGSFTCTKPTGLRVTHTECGLVRLAWNDYPFGVNETGYEIIRTDPNGSNFWIASVAANTTSYTITNTNYNAFGQTTSNSYKIAGIFNYTQTQYSDPVSASFTCPVPTNLKVVLSDCFKVNLAWDDLPISYSESGYIIYREGNGSNYQIGEVGANVLTFVDNTYKETGVNYTYKIAAKINGRTTDFSNQVSASFDCIPPSDLEVTAATCGEISLKWKNNYTGPVLVFIYRSKNGLNGTYDQIQYYNQNLNTYIDKGGLYDPLLEGVTYFYKIKVEKNRTTTDFSNAASASFNCIAPENLQVTGSSCGEFTLNWPDYSAGINETGYNILRSTSMTDGYSYLATVSTNTLSYIDNTVYNYSNTNYKFYYKIVGKFNNTTTLPSNSATAVYTCPIVQNLRLVGTNCGVIGITWDALPTNLNVKKYIIYRSSTSGGGFHQIDNITNNTTYVDNNNLQLGETYTYKVKALINNIETDLGNEVSASFTCQAPKNLKVTTSSCGQISLSWDDYSTINESGYILYRYNPNSYNNYQEIANLPANTLSFTDFGFMTADVPQVYLIKGKFSDTYTNFSIEATGSFSCETPGTLRAVSNKCGQIELSWDDFPSSFSESNYVVYRSDSGVNGNFYQIAYLNANTFSFIDNGSNSGLIQGSKYYYQIRGKYLNSLTVGSNTVESQTNCQAPDNFKITNIECGKISLAWDDFPNTIRETGYTILRSTNGENGNYNVLARLNANITSFVDEGANYNEFYVSKTYHYKISANFNNTVSLLSAAVFGKFTCEIPQNLAIKSTICGAVTLKWDDLPAGISETGYQIFRSNTSNSNFNYSSIGSVNANVLQYIDLGNLSPNTTYYYKIAAKIGNVISDLSNEVSSKINCQIPTGLVITSANCGEISLEWDKTIIASGGYEIYRADEINNFNYTLAGTVPFNVYSFVDKGNLLPLNAGTKYYYKIKARIINTLTDFSNTVSDSFTCENPVNLSLSSSNCGAISLKWDDFQNLSETGYEIFRSEYGINGTYIKIGTVNSNITAYIDYGNSQNFYAGKVYFYKIKGKINNNFTIFSNTISASFSCPLPQNLIVNATSCGQIELKWDAYLNTNALQLYRSENGANGDFNYFQELSYYNSTTFIDNGNYSGILVNKVYHYKIRLKRNNIITDFSNIAQGSFTCDIPQNLVVSSTQCDEINLKWDDFPANINETGYNIYRSRSNLNGEFYLIGSTGLNVLTYRDTGGQGGVLSAGISFYYKIKGRFINSTTDFGNVTYGSFQCEIPQNPVAVSNSCGQIKINWGIIQSAKAYTIYKSEFEFGNYEQIGTTQSSIGEYIDINFLNASSKKYFYKISARFSNNSYSELSTACSMLMNCAIPQNLKITEVICGTVKLSWDDLPPEYEETGYKIYRIEKNGNEINYTEVGNVAANILNYNDTGNYNRSFRDGVTYYYRIIAKFGNSTTDFSNEVIVKMDCQTIITPNLVSATCGKITINWNTLSNEQISTYAIVRSKSLIFSNVYPIGYSNAPANTFTDNSFNLEPGTTYYYKIFGLIGNLSVEATNIVSASFSCGTELTLSITSNECNKISLAWVDNSTAIPKSNYTIYRANGDNNFYFVGSVNSNLNVFDDTGYYRPIQSGINYQY